MPGSAPRSPCWRRSSPARWAATRSPAPRCRRTSRPWPFPPWKAAPEAAPQIYALVERFADRTRLSLEPDEAEADLVVRATVERYTVAPAAVTGDEVAALNRVTLGVRVVATNRLDESDLLDRAFTATADYAPAEGLAGESDAAQRALEQIAQDAFTAATSDW